MRINSRKLFRLFTGIDRAHSDRHSRRAGLGLDWLNLFVANIQTGFGPFIAIYLATQGWTQTSIGFALSLGTMTAMASQLPAGALIDAMRSKVRAAGISVVVFSLSALMFGVAPLPLFVYGAEILHAFASCMLGPAIAVMSLQLAGPRHLGPRLGRNARFASIGNAIGAVLMGACGYYLSDRAIFFLTAALTLPALGALAPLSSHARHRHVEPKAAKATKAGILATLSHKHLLVFAGCAALFTCGNAATLPLVSTALTKTVGGAATLFIAACIVVPQIIVAVVSPTVGRLAESYGRRWVLVIGFCALPLRCAIFTTLLPHPVFVVMAQALDGIAASCFGVLVPLITSDLAGRSGHYNLSLGFIGFAIGIGATVSTALGGWIADRQGDAVAFLVLGAIGILAILLALFAMADTRLDERHG